MAWNGSDHQPTSCARANAPRALRTFSRRRGFFAALLFVVLVGAALWFFFLRSPTPDSNSNSLAARSPARIVEQKPAPARTNKVAKAEIAKPRAARVKIIPESVTRDACGVLRWPNGARYVEDYSFHTNAINPYAGQKRIFKQPSDIHIATLVNLTPGQMVIGGFQYGSDFDEHFRKSLDEPIKFEDDDTEDERRIKEDVISARETLKQAMAQGRSPSEIMQETRDELVKMFQYKHNLEQQLTAISRDEGMSDKDQLDAFEAANIMLKERGISEFSTEIIERRIKRLNQKGGERK